MDNRITKDSKHQLIGLLAILANDPLSFDCRVKYVSEDNHSLMLTMYPNTELDTLCVTATPDDSIRTYFIANVPIVSRKLGGVIWMANAIISAVTDVWEDIVEYPF